MITFNDITIQADMCFELTYESDNGCQHTAFIGVHDYDFDGTEFKVNEVSIVGDNVKGLLDISDEVVELVNTEFSEYLIGVMLIDSVDSSLEGWG